MGAGGVCVGAGAVGDGGNGILPPSDCSKRFQNLASSLVRLSCVNDASLAATTAIALSAKKNFIVIYIVK